MNTTKRRIYFYLRNSTQQQEYEYQRNELQTHLDKFNDVTLVKIYSDKLSGFEINRPNIQLLLQDVDQGLVDEIWCNEFMRLSRDAINLQEIVKHCSDKKVNIYFKQQDLNTLDSRGDLNVTTKILISILGNFGEMDAQNFKQKGVAGKVSKAKLGNYVGGTLPAGYTYINEIGSKKIVIDEKKKKIIEFCFDQIANKKLTLNSVAKKLNNLKNIDSDYETIMKSKNYGTVNAKWKYNIWSMGVVKNIINCTWYAEGYRIFNNEKIVIDENLKFIDLDLYNRANEQLKLNSFSKSKTKHTYLIKDLIYCSCGQKMYPKNSAIRFYYKCYTNIKKDTDKSYNCDEAKTIAIEQIENNIFLLIQNKLPEFKVSVANKVNKHDKVNKKINENKKMIDVIESITLKNLTEYRKREISVYTRLGGDETDFYKLIEKIDRDIKEQQTIISQLISENNQFLISLSENDVVAEFEYKMNMIQNDKNMIKFYIRKFIKKIIICGGLKNQLFNVVKIQWHDRVNNDNDTYLLYKSKVSQNPLYYFLSPNDENTTIQWSKETLSFTFSNESNSVNLDTNQIMNKIDALYGRQGKIKVKSNVFDKREIEPNIFLNLGCDIMKIVSPMD